MSGQWPPGDDDHDEVAAGELDQQDPETAAQAKKWLKDANIGN